MLNECLMGTRGWQVTIAAAIVVVVFYGGVALYVVGSYFFARSHHAEREFSLTFREALREGMFAALIQPLLPLYYFIGRRMGGRAGKRPIVLVHGYGQNRVDFVWLARALERAGMGPMYGFNYWPFGRIRSSAEELARFVSQVCEAEKADAVDIVSHSMGGLVAMKMIEQGGARVRRLVTIGTPHAGVAWRGPILGLSAGALRRGTKHVREERTLELAALSIFSTHDNVVGSAATSSLAAIGGRDLVVPGLGHLAMLFDRRVASEIVSFLDAKGDD
jgi:triacylglycerol lipase